MTEADEMKDPAERPGRISSDLPSIRDVLTGTPRVASPVPNSPAVLPRDDLHEVREEDAMSGEFVQVDGSVGGSGYDETTVDIIAVPCPGADPLETWTRDALLENYFGAPSMRNSDLRDSQTNSQASQGQRSRGMAVGRSNSRNTPSWVRLGIRKEANKARVLMYRHKDPVEGTTLSGLADGLLERISETRPSDGSSRPIFFVCHSIGGLVVKMALSKASRNNAYERILNDCYGAAFFATPHRGSSYLHMSDIAPGIQFLLQLTHPLPRSLTEDLRVGHPLLLHMDEEFRPLASDLQIWTFYETIDSRISSATEARPGDVYFTAPITSLKSAILGIRQERIFPLQSDHANCASFGRNNTQTMKLFLKDLGKYIAKADVQSRRPHAEMNLEGKVSIEVHGFYEDPVAVTSAETLTTVRAWSTRVPLGEYLLKGPLEVLNDRLNEVTEGPVEAQFLAARRRTTRLKDKDDGPLPDLADASDLELGQNVLGIQSETDGGSMEVLLSEDMGSTVPNSPRVGTTPKNSPNPNVNPNPDLSAIIRTTSRDGRASAEESRTAATEPRSRSTSERRGSHSTDAPTPNSPRSNRRVALTRRFTDQFNAKWNGQLDRTIYRGSGYDARAEQDTCVPVLSRPDPSNRRFIWTHLPYTNPAWVKKIFETMEVKEGKDFTELFNHGHWYSKHTRGRHSQHYAYFVKPACSLIPPKPMSPLSHHSSNPTDNGPTVYLFLPFLHFDTYKALLRRRALITRRLRQGRARPVPQSVARLESLELRVIWEYLSHDPPVNCRRTLDQYGYPSLHDTRPRDDDQMLYKMTKERVVGEVVGEAEMGGSKSSLRGGSGLGREGGNGQVGRRDGSSLGSGRGGESESSDEEGGDEGEDVLNGNVLMVDQLWMWAIGPNTLLTFFSKRESDTTEGPLYQQADLRDSIFNDVNSDLTRQCDTAFDMAALTALHAVTVLMDRASHPDLEVFRIFEEAISILTEKMTSSLKDFRTQSLRPKAPDDPNDDPAPRSIRARHAEEAARTERENRDSTSALLELRDLEDELSTLSTLFDTQYKLLDKMRASYLRLSHTSTPPSFPNNNSNNNTTNTNPQTSSSSPSPSGLPFLTEAIARLADYRHRSNSMILRARSTRADYDKLLQMVQRQAQVDEVRLQRLQADLASAQGRSVVIFTTFTVIFLPLSFFTSLFGMNTREWSPPDRVPTLQTISLIALPASAALIFLALVTAWSTRVRRLFVALGHAGTYFAGAASGATNFGGRAFRRVVRWKEEETLRRREERAKRERRRARQRQRKMRKEMSADSGDFWERHRLERDDEYTIPVGNRRSVIRERGAARVTGDKK